MRCCRIVQPYTMVTKKELLARYLDFNLQISIFKSCQLLL